MNYIKRLFENVAKFFFPIRYVMLPVKNYPDVETEWDVLYEDTDEIQHALKELMYATASFDPPNEPGYSNSKLTDYEFEVGDIVKVKDDAWRRYLENSGRNLLNKGSHEHTPQRIEVIHHRYGIRLTFPFWWWEYEDIEHIEH